MTCERVYLLISDQLQTSTFLLLRADFKAVPNELLKTQVGLEKKTLQKSTTLE